jgi:alpha-ribazole phosphatase
MDVYLVRHGITKWNLEKRYLGHTDEPLLIRERNKLNPLRHEMENMSFDFCYSSDLKRCTETIHYLLPNERVCLDSRLRELHFGDWEGLTYEMLKNDLSYQEWIMDWEKKAPPNGESYQKLMKRLNSFLAELLSLAELTDHHKNVLIVTHGGLIRSIMQSFELTKTFWDVHVHHGMAYLLSLQYKRGKWVCNSWSVVPIQEKEM